MSLLIPTSTRPVFNWAGARATGAAHTASGVPCQDAFALHMGTCRGEPYLVAAVADGAGSAQFAEHGSCFAVTRFSAFIIEELPAWGLDGLDDLALDAAFGVHRSLRRMASDASLSADQFATTLLGMIVTPHNTSLLQIGDGGIVMGNEQSGWRAVFPPQHGEYHNESRFITDADAFDWLQQSQHGGPPQTIVAFTDGLEDLLLCPRTLAVHPPLFDQIARQLATSPASGHLSQVSTAIADLLVSGPVRSRTDDDATFLAIRFDETMP